MECTYFLELFLLQLGNAQSGMARYTVVLFLDFEQSPAVSPIGHACSVVLSFPTLETSRNGLPSFRLPTRISQAKILELGLPFPTAESSHPRLLLLLRWRWTLYHWATWEAGFSSITTPIYVPSTVYEGSLFSPHPASAHFLAYLHFKSILTDVVISRCGFICITLIISFVEHLFMCLLVGHLCLLFMLSLCPITWIRFVLVVVESYESFMFIMAPK